MQVDRVVLARARTAVVVPAVGEGVGVLAGHERRSATGARAADDGLACDVVRLERPGDLLVEAGVEGTRVRRVGVRAAGGLRDAGQLRPRGVVDLEPDGVDDQVDARLLQLRGHVAGRRR